MGNDFSTTQYFYNSFFVFLLVFISAVPENQETYVLPFTTLKTIVVSLVYLSTHEKAVT